MMDIRPLRTEADYDAALAAIEAFFDDEPDPGSPEADAFDLLALVIADYERRHWPTTRPTPYAIRYRMETGGFSPADLGRLLGSRQRASDILNRKRLLALRMAKKLHREWGVPAKRFLGWGRRCRMAESPVAGDEGGSAWYVAAAFAGGATREGGSDADHRAGLGNPRSSG